MTDDQFAELLRAIDALRPAWYSGFVPMLSVVVGAVIGFGVSRLNLKLDRRDKRATERRGAVASRRQAAVDLFVRQAQTYIEGFQVVDRNAAQKVTDQVYNMLLVTGMPTDDEVAKFARAYLLRLEMSLDSYEVKPAPMGNSRIFIGQSAYPDFTEGVQQMFEEQLRELRGSIQEWVDEDRSSRWMVHKLNEAAGLNDSLHAESKRIAQFRIDTAGQRGSD